MATTRGGLKPALIYEKGNKGTAVSCMFNPHEYKVTKKNSYVMKERAGGGVPHLEFSQAGAQTLQLNLFFDTYESGEDVSRKTNKLWSLMQPKEQRGQKKKEPREVVFEWGVFLFEAVIESMTQTFTLFTKEGTPVHATVDATFTQYEDKDDYPNQNPTSGGGPVLRARMVVGHDRLDTIAYEVYGDATKWPLIAQHNQILDPFNLRPGQELIIPELT